MDLVLYIHGRGGSADEAAHYAPLFPGKKVLGLDYRGATPWEAGAEVRAALEKLKTEPPFTHRGLFRTEQPEQYWLAGLGKGVCAVELTTGDDAATYLYRFPETQEVFLRQLELAMEAMGPHREIIYWTEEQIAEKPLYRMAVMRCEAVSFLRDRSAGRLIHNASHAARLREFLEG